MTESKAGKAGEVFKDYSSNVLWGWDWKSHATKWEVDNANELTSEWVKSLLTWKDGEIRLWDYILSMWTDWVWTKIQIYMRQFENDYREYNKSEKSEADYNIVLEKAIELCDRMLSDLAAMLFDDWIKWERSIAFTNIIDTNTTEWERSDIFFKAFKISLWKSIINNDTLSLNWETANLGETGKLVRALERYRESWEFAKREINERKEQIKMARKLKWSEELISSIRDSITSIFWEAKEVRTFVENLLEEIELNLAWTFLWIKSSKEENEKLVEMEEGDKIIVLSETKTENGILSPRSNWLTLIRKLMTQLLWDNWEDKRFEDYLLAIWEKAWKLPKESKEKLAWLKMWDIATWKTTIFNGFIADDLLWGIDWKPMVKISWLRHGTWNPQFKLYSGLEWREDIMIDMDISDLEVPDIFTLLQVAFDLDDETVAKPFNMAMPYHIFCKPWEEDKILEQAEKSWITANVVWEIRKREEWDPSVKIKWVWIWKSEITYSKN